MEMDRIKSGKYTFEQAKQNKSKNRYTDIIPFDQNLLDLPFYINASPLHGLDGTVYIATQGPLESTIRDFWMMAFVKKSPLIVMLTLLEEGHKKCSKYWPDTQWESDGLSVRLVQEQETRFWIKRSFQVKCNGQSHLVDQLHFSEWPDHSVCNPLLLLDLIRESRKYADPWIVHCSAGCGRTATFCAVDALWKASKKDAQSVEDQVDQFRKDRIGSVQTLEQYQLIQQCLQLL
ncbi:protein-tyrosine phosphatase-like protein [Gorgonomyces haynaldii]|nr:protein-tyrosine phosphatase-like protein [Gorgonomyces haynaldii]